ncbi:hypothetical protein CEXT_787191 [Caerostris extrusa]|uniref:Uncharacterized protein n=1 Tax=Caerostris extrusa TaxID=172846 RepID=A0AAV4MTL9_CAEEX|nr:hypothetical protein CEXT_787191 [Caerostris extrusa]
MCPIFTLNLASPENNFASEALGFIKGTTKVTPSVPTVCFPSFFIRGARMKAPKSIFYIFRHGGFVYRPKGAIEPNSPKLVSKAAADPGNVMHKKAPRYTKTKSSGSNGNVVYSRNKNKRREILGQIRKQQEQEAAK